MFSFSKIYTYTFLLCIFIVITHGENSVVSKSNKTSNTKNGTTTSKTETVELLQHMGREQVLESPSLKPTTANNITFRENEKDKPVVETIPDIAPHQDGGKPSVPKKGVSFSDLDKRTNVTAVVNETKLNKNGTNNGIDNNLKKIFSIADNTKIVPNNQSSSIKQHKKPLFTESDNDYIDISKISNLSKEAVISADQIDPLISKTQTKRADYIVPIVAVILSVPLVAILLSFIYKRSADWWQHRNYKRMDFLIEGMYHN